MHCGIDPSSVNNNTVKMTDVEHESQIPRPKNSTESSKETFPNKDSKITPPEQWVDLYGDYLYRYALSRLKNPDQASDCVQDTFLAGIKSLEKFDGRMDIKFWLRVARSKRRQIINFFIKL